MEEKTNNTLIWVIGIILVLLGIVYFVVLQNFSSNNLEDETGVIKVGVVLPLSGEKAVIGNEIKKTYDLAVKEINETGGINDQTLELIYQDGKCNGKTAREVGEILINDKKVHFILGGVCSEETLSLAKITEEAGILLLSPTSSDPNISNAGQLVFRTYPSYDFDGKLFAEYAILELKAKKVAILVENTSFTESIRNTFTDEAEKLKAKVVFNESFDADQTDFKELISKLKSSRPDITYIATESSETGQLILQEISDSRVRGEIFSSNTLLNRTVFKDKPRLYRKLILAETTVNEEREKTKDFIATFEDEYGEVPKYINFSTSAYDGIYLLAEGIKEVGIETEEIADYFLESVKNWSGALGELTFDKNGDIILKLNLIQVQRDGTTKVLDF